VADSIRIEVDATRLLAQLASVGAVAWPRIREAAYVTARAVQTEARARLARQTAGTGRTAEAITIDEIGGGYRVFVGPQSGRPDNLPYWLEEGTVKMRRRPFMRDAATLEERPYRERIARALQAALDEVSTRG